MIKEFVSRPSPFGDTNSLITGEETAASATPASSGGTASRYGATGSGHLGSGAGGIRRISTIPASAGIHRCHVGTVPSWSALYLMPVPPVSIRRSAATATSPRPARRVTRPARG